MATPVYVIAEAGVNHNGQRDMAFELVDKAADSGADAVKFQTFNAQKLAARTAPKAAYQKRTTDSDESQLAMLKKLELPLEWHADLQNHAAKRGIQFLSTAFDLDSLAFLETLDLPFYKIPSGEITNGPLLWEFARTGRRLVVSTGMATLGEVEEALAVLAHGICNSDLPKSSADIWQFWGGRDALEAVRNRVSLLHCTSQYPTAFTEVNLAAMDTLAQAFGLPVGYSDHTEGTLIPIAAVARGVCIIEKHFTLSRDLPGPDHKASLIPGELAEMVAAIRGLEVAIGDSRKVPQLSEWDSRKAARQSLVASQAIRAGDVFTQSNITTARAGGGISAMRYWDYLGATASRATSAGEAL